MTDEEIEEVGRRVHHALGGYLDDGELAIAWTVTIDVAGPEGIRYLAHRAGGGHDGTDRPTAWAALGMLRASMQIAERQLADAETDPDTDDDD